MILIVKGTDCLIQKNEYDRIFLEEEYSLLSFSRASKFSWRLFSIDSQLSLPQNKIMERILVWGLPVPQKATVKKGSIDISFEVV